MDFNEGKKEILVNNNTGVISGNIEEKINKISLNEALSNTGHFNKNLNIINEDFNYADLLISEFKKLKTIDDFEKYEEKFGNQRVLFTSLKLNKKYIYLEGNKSKHFVIF